ncbi:MAG: hypothetical protein OHK0015_11810 [Chloroflexi bacterium OHK40]
MNSSSTSQHLSDLLRHLRNKNFAVLPRHAGPAETFVDRLVGWANRAREFVLARRGFRLVVSEQIVEHPMVLSHLRPADRRILDFGGYESVLPLQLTALGREVTVLDQRRYPFQHPNLCVVCCDLLDPQLSLGAQYDLVVSISTIEHLGLGNYGDIQEVDADRRGVSVLWSLVRPGGRLMASVPAGRPAVQRGYRVYDEARIRATFPATAYIHWFRKHGREGAWREVTANDVQQVVYGEPLGQMPVEAVAFIICEKPLATEPVV